MNEIRDTLRCAPLGVTMRKPINKPLLAVKRALSCLLYLRAAFPHDLTWLRLARLSSNGRSP